MAAHLTGFSGLRFNHGVGGFVIGLEELLFKCACSEFRRLAFGDLGQAGIFFGAVIITAFFIDLHEAVKQHHLTGGAQADLAIVAGNINGGAFQPGRFHLAGQRALPDQIIELALIGVGDFQRGGIAGHIRGADTFVGFLRVFGFVFVHAR